MNTVELIAALQKLGTAYTNKEKTKPADPILKVIAFLEKRTEKTLDELVAAVQSPVRSTGATKNPASQPSAMAAEYLERLNIPSLSKDDFENLYKGIRTLQKTPLVQIARGYTSKSKLDTKPKALAAIREEFFERARERDKARKDEHSLMM